MKKYNIHVILGGRFHSVVIECDGFVQKDGCYSFYKKPETNNLHPESDNAFAWYPVANTVIELDNPNLPKGASGSHR